MVISSHCIIIREHNIIEYKSPDDYVSRSDFQKVQAYAWLYASRKNLPTQNLTITLVESGHPRDLIHHLKTDLGYGVEESESGLYIIEGMPMPVQIIESRKLSAQENMWLRNLRELRDAESLAGMLNAVQKRGKEVPLKAYAHVLLATANINVMKEVREMATTMELFEVFRDIVGFDEEWEEKVMEKGRKAEQMKMTKNLLAHGVDPVIIAKSSGLALDKIREIAAKL